MNPETASLYNGDDLARQDGLLRSTPSLSLDLPDQYIIKTLHKVIQDSVDFYDDINEFNLKNKRLKNQQMMEGRHLQQNKLYRHQTPFIDNEIYVGLDAIEAYVTAQTPRSEIYPAGDSEENKLFAKNLEDYQLAHSEEFRVSEMLEGVVDNLMGKYVGFIKFRWDPFYGEDGEVVPEVVDSNHVIVDKNAKRGQNPRFICHVLKDTVEGLIAKFPDKEKQIQILFSIKRKGPINQSAEIAYREVWFTYYKDNKPEEAVAWYVRDLVLDKRKNPNWLYEGEGKNFLKQPMKPFIPFNMKNNGAHWYDKTSPLEQAIPQQEILNKLGRQIIDNLATANGFRVWDSKATSKDDLQNMTGDPNQSFLAKVPQGKSINDVVTQLDPQIVSQTLVMFFESTVQRIQNILGTPSQFTGDDEGLAKTASTNQMVKNQASGRQDKIVRAIDRGMDLYFKFEAQMFCVWYDSKHYATVNGGDGNFDFIEMHKSKIQKGMMAHVQSGTTLPFDKARQESVAQNAAELEFLAPIDYYKLMHMDNPQKLFDNLVKWKTQPQELAMDIASNESDGDAIIDFTELMGGHKPEQRDDATPEYLEQMRKQMITDAFLQAPRNLQNKVIKFVKVASDSLALRQELDQMSAPPPPPPIPAPVQATLPPQPPMMPQMPGMPPAAPGQPPMPPPMPGSPIQAIMQGQPPPMPPGLPPQPLGGEAPLGAIPPQMGQPPGLNAQPQVNTDNTALPPF